MWHTGLVQMPSVRSPSGDRRRCTDVAFEPGRWRPWAPPRPTPTVPDPLGTAATYQLPPGLGRLDPTAITPCAIGLRGDVSLVASYPLNGYHVAAYEPAAFEV